LDTPREDYGLSMSGTLAPANASRSNGCRLFDKFLVIAFGFGKIAF